MRFPILKLGDRVRIVSNSPFKGLKGTVKKVDRIAAFEDEQPFLFYLIRLEGSYIKEPVWFQYEEVESVSLSEKIEIE